MAFGVGAALLDALVLSVAEQGDTYGYEISQTLRDRLDVSDSTLYPVLRRLQRDACLECYDKPISGRNRRYYRITEQGCERLRAYRAEWLSYRQSIDTLLRQEECL